MIEKLTDKERRWLAVLDDGRGEKALRIIDQLTEALAAAERLRDSHHEAHVSAEQRALTAEARVRELERMAELDGRTPREMCVSGYVGNVGKGECNDCGKHHEAPTDHDRADERYSHGKLTRTEAEQRVLDALEAVKRYSHGKLTRTEAEQRVLDALEAVPDGTLESLRDDGLSASLRDVAIALLARREGR